MQGERGIFTATVIQVVDKRILRCFAKWQNIAPAFGQTRLGNSDPPQTVDEEAAYLKNDMEHIALLFLYSDYAAPYIGGPIEIYPIPSP